MEPWTWNDTSLPIDGITLARLVSDGSDVSLRYFLMDAANHR